MKSGTDARPESELASEKGERSSSRAVELAYWALVGAALAAYAIAHRSLGLSFPIPWPDEASFMWPAIAVAERSSLLAPELNPERPLCWMPPVYMLVQGAIFKLTGFTLTWARWLRQPFGGP